jgi:hypothetical protein
MMGNFLDCKKKFDVITQIDSSLVQRAAIFTQGILKSNRHLNEGGIMYSGCPFMNQSGDLNPWLRRFRKIQNTHPSYVLGFSDCGE